MTNELQDSLSVREKLKETASAVRDKLFKTGWWHSIDLGDGHISPGVHTIEELRENYARLDLPDDLTGKRVLDIGCWDGFYAFEAERRGAAEVVAIDYWRSEKFFEAHRALKSNVKFHEMSVYDIGREKFGSFDIVLFLGVLYHVRHPLLALERVCEITRDIAIIESYVIDDTINSPRPLMEFYETDELGGQYDNWWGPNTDCLTRMIRSAGFVRTNALCSNHPRAAVKAFRQWEPVSGEPSQSITIRDVVNSVTFKHVYPRRGGQAYVTVWAEGIPPEATRETVGVNIGGYGAAPCYVGHSSNPADEAYRTQINCPVPPGLDNGPNRLHVFHDNLVSNEVEISLVDQNGAPPTNVGALSRT
jgi:tRNA (mo5U34)-methyltransferase